mgnify:CR=1 FL=1
MAKRVVFSPPGPNNPNSPRGVESSRNHLLAESPKLVQTTLIPLGELKGSLKKTSPARVPSPNNPNSPRGVERKLEGLFIAVS